MMTPIIRRRRPSQSAPVLRLLPVPDPKPKLEMTAIPVFRVKRRALEAYISLIYRFEFDFLLAVGQVEGMNVEHTIDGELPGEAWLQRAHELRCGRRTRDVNLILTVLARDGFIPRGRYVIDTRPENEPSRTSSDD